MAAQTYPTSDEEPQESFQVREQVLLRDLLSNQAFCLQVAIRRRFSHRQSADNDTYLPVQRIARNLPCHLHWQLLPLPRLLSLDEAKSERDANRLLLDFPGSHNPLRHPCPLLLHQHGKNDQRQSFRLEDAERRVYCPRLL